MCGSSGYRCRRVLSFVKDVWAVKMVVWGSKVDRCVVCVEEVGKVHMCRIQENYGPDV